MLALIRKCKNWFTSLYKRYSFISDIFWGIGIGLFAIGGVIATFASFGAAAPALGLSLAGLIAVCGSPAIAAAIGSAIVATTTILTTVTGWLLNKFFKPKPPINHIIDKVPPEIWSLIPLDAQTAKNLGQACKSLNVLFNSRQTEGSTSKLLTYRIMQEAENCENKRETKEVIPFEIAKLMVSFPELILTNILYLFKDGHYEFISPFRYYIQNYYIHRGFSTHAIICRRGNEHLINNACNEAKKGLQHLKRSDDKENGLLVIFSKFNKPKSYKPHSFTSDYLTYDYGVSQKESFNMLNLFKCFR